jgi:hypothetical protein
MHRVNKCVAWLTKKNTAEIIQIVMITVAVPSNKETLAPRAGNFLVPIWLLRLHGSIVRGRRVHIASLMSYSTAVHASYVLMRQQLRVHTLCQRNQKTALYAHTQHTKSMHRHSNQASSSSDNYTSCNKCTSFFSNNSKMFVYETSAA